MGTTSSGYIIVVLDEEGCIKPYKEFFEEKPNVGSILSIDNTLLVEVTDVYTTSFGSLFAAKQVKILTSVPPLLPTTGVRGCRGVTKI